MAYPKEVTSVKVSEGTQFDRTGRTTQVRTVTYYVGDHGPFYYTKPVGAALTPMPTWAQIIFATWPIAAAFGTGLFWVVRHISHLEGKVDAMLALFAANLAILVSKPNSKAKDDLNRAAGG